MEDHINAYGRTAPQKSPAKEINLKELFATLQRRLWIVLLSTVVIGTLGGLYNSIPDPPVYGASARVMISADTPEMLGTLKVFIREPVVLERVIKELGLKQSVGNLRNQIGITSVDNSIITVVSALDQDPRLAVKIANSVVSTFTEEAAARLKFRGVEVLTSAQESPNPVPVNPHSNRIVFISIFAGLVIGVGGAFLLDSLDDSIRSKDDIENLLELNVLGSVSTIKKKDLFSKAAKRKNEYIRGETLGS